MFIGYLKEAKYSYTIAKTKAACPPDSCEEGLFAWSWKALYCMGLDVHVDLGRECYVGAVTLPLGPKARITSLEVYSDGELVGKYYAETGKTTNGRVTAPVGVNAKNLTLRVGSTTSEVSFTEPEIAVAYEDSNPLVWPTPESVVFGEGSVMISEATSSDNADEIYAKDFLLTRLTERFGNNATCNCCGVPVKLVINNGAEYEGERFTVEVTPNGITLTAGKRISLMYAVCALLSVGCGGKFRVCKIDDKPAKEMRGFHMGLPKKANVDFAKRLFRYVLLPLGYNQLFVEFCGGMRFDSHPEISEGWLEGNKKAALGLQPKFPHDYMGAEGELIEKDDVRDLLGYARELGFEIIPEVQSLGHVQFLTYAHPEIGEKELEEKVVKDARFEDLRPNNFYTHCYCPSNEKSYEIIFDLIDEIIEVAQPQRYVHIGHDEVYHLGKCPKCKDTPHSVLFARDVNRLYNYLKEKGYGTMMWSDMIQPVTKYETPDAIDMLPKDIVMLDFIWYFHLTKDIEENLLAKDYKVVAGNLYSSHYPRYKKRMTTEGMIGGEVSTWCAVNEYRLGKKGKFWDLTYTAQMLWKPESYDENMREVYGYIINKYMQPVQRDEIRVKYNPNGYNEECFAIPDGDKTDIPEKLLSYRPSAIVANDATVTIGGKYTRLKIEHATLRSIPRHPWVELRVCGAYTVKYSDGSTESIPAQYAGNVQALNRRYGDPLREDYHRHTGYIGTWFSDPTLAAKNTDGSELLLTEYVWENPYPDKVIESISYKDAEGDLACVILSGVKGLNPNA